MFEQALKNIDGILRADNAGSALSTTKEILKEMRELDEESGEILNKISKTL